MHAKIFRSDAGISSVPFSQMGREKKSVHVTCKFSENLRLSHNLKYNDKRLSFLKR